MRHGQIALLLVIALLFTSKTYAQRDFPDSKSIFWEITGKNLKKPSYIYGTMHVSRKVAFKVPRQFFQAINDVDIVALESSPESWQPETDKDSSLSYLTRIYGHRESSYLHSRDDIYTAMLGMYSLSKGYLKWLISRKSSLANQLLFRANSMEKDFSEDTYLDFYIFQMGKRLGKPILSLEDVVVSSIKAYKASLEEYAKVDNRKEKFENVGEIISEAYEDRDIALIDSCYREAFDPKYMDYLLYSRNADMMHTFDSVASMGTSVFMAVGAAHLPNKLGMLQRLKEAGYTVKPIVDSSFFDPSQELQKYDTMFVGATFEPQKSQDGAITWLAPGYNSRKLEVGLIEYLCPDMPNGTYYSLDRIPLFHGFMEPTNLIDRLDSLVYESTSGKVLDKETRKVNGYNALLIKSKSSEAKNVHSLYIATPYELIIAKVESHEKYDIEPNSEKYFSSLKISYPSTTQTVDLGDLSVTMPVTIADPVYDTYDLNQPLNMLLGHSDKGDDYLAVKSRRNSDNSFEKDSFETRFMTEVMAREMKADIVKGGFEKYRGQASYFAELKKGKQKYFVRTIVRGDNYYTFAVNTSAKNKAEEFLSSINFHSVKDRVMKYHNDSMQYSIDATVVPYGEQLNPLIFKYQVNHSSFATDSKKKRHINYFQNPKEGYNIEINVNQLNPYMYHRDIDSYWTDFKDDLKEKFETNDAYTVDEIKKLDKPNFSQRAYKLSDTSSSSVTIFNAILTDDKEYTASTVIDTNSQISKEVMRWVMEFDVKEQGPIYLSNSTYDTFINHAFSSDSLTKLIFENNYKKFSLDSIDAPRLMLLLDTSKIIKRKEAVYYHLLEQLADIKTLEVRNYLKKMYLANRSDFDNQFEVLYTLALMKDTPSAQLFKELILDDPPLTTSRSSSDVAGPSALFNAYYRKPEVAKILYPEILNLMDYEEYNNPVLRMTALLSRFHDLDTSAYAIKKVYFYNKLNEDFRRQTSQKTLIEDKMDELEEDKESDDYYSSDQQYYLRQTKLTSQYLNSELDLFSYYDLFRYQELNKKFKNDPKVARILHKIDTSTYTDLRLYTSLDRMEDTLDYSLAPIKQHLAYFDFRIPLYQKMYENNQADSLSKLVNSAQDYATDLMKYKIKYKPKDSFEYVKMKPISAADNTGDIYVFKYKKKGFEKWRYGMIGLFPKNKKIINDFVFIDDIDLQELKLTVDELVDKMKYQFQAIKREYISPQDFSINIDEKDDDPFSFMLYR